MSQRSLDGKAEVMWDNDSPTPAVWKRLQDPRKGADDGSGSPKLPRPVRRLQPTRSASTDDNPQFEKSKKTANEMIEALQRVSRENTATQTEHSRLNFTVPEIVEEEDSDNEKAEPDFPFKNMPNSSLDIIFDQSGKGEDLAPTAKSNFSTFPVEKSSPASDAWTDDDIFTEELLSQVDQELKVTPKKPQVLSKETKNLSVVSSTPNNVKNCNEVDHRQHGHAKSFLNFMVETAKPPKPSPSKHKSHVLEKRRDDTYLHKSTSSPSNDCTSIASNSSVTHGNEETNPVNVSIPLEVLQDFMLDDSFAELDHVKHAQTRRSKTTSCLANSTEASSNRTLPAEIMQRSNTLPMPKVEHSTRTSFHNHAASKRLPNKIRKIVKQPSNSTSSCLAGNKQVPVEHIDFINSFSSDDEEMLLKAVALTESQRSQAKSEQDRTEDKSTSSQTTATNTERTKQIKRSSSSQPKCTASEIERKKQIALSKRRCKMKQKFV